LDLVLKFLKGVTCEKIILKTSVGTKDAFFTGLATGAIWFLKSVFLVVFLPLTKEFKKPLLQVWPNFSKETIYFNTNIIISFSIGHAIYILYRLMKLKKNERGVT